MSRTLHIASVGSDVDSIILALRTFPASKVVAVHFKSDARVVAELAERLLPLQVEVEGYPVKSETLVDVLSLVADIVQREGERYDEVLVNPSGGSNMLSCSLLSGAFVNGLRAVGVADGKVMMLPVIRLSYPEAVSPPKLRVLRALRDAGGSVQSLQELVKRTGSDKPLLSYHIRGSAEGRGLEEMDLVTVERGKQGRLEVALTETAKLLLVGDHEKRGQRDPAPGNDPAPLEEE